MTIGLGLNPVFPLDQEPHLNHKEWSEKEKRVQRKNRGYW
jgi:hypothetical protein